MAESLDATNLHNPDEPPTREELPFVARRLSVLFAAFLLIILVYLGRAYELTIIDGPTYRDMSENNFLLQSPLPAQRGRILDSKGEPLAVNETYFSVEMSPFRLSRDDISASLGRLAELLGTPNLLKEVDQVLKLRPRWKAFKLASRLPLDRVLPVMEQAPWLPGIQVNEEYRRFYPAGETAGLLTGHVGGIDRNQIETYTDAGYLSTEMIGKMGAEKSFEDILHGEQGMEIITRDAQGRVRSRSAERSAQPGHTVVLTIDMGLQRLSDQLLAGWKGVIIAMDPRDGSILAMVSHPGFDPEHPGSIGTPEHPLTAYNKASSTGFAPGSTFKIVTASAGLMSGFSPDEIINCDGTYMLGNVRFRCNVVYGHDNQNMFQALQHSCNVFFYTWAHRLGGPKLLDMAAAYGMGAKTGFELEDADKPGLLAVPGKDPIFPGSVVQMGIGQGQLLSVTPLQMARAYAALCNGGVLYKPRVFKEERTADGELVRSGEKEAQGRIPITDQQRQEILEGLWRVVNEKGGTAAKAGIKPEWRVAGKSGTADVAGQTKPNAWFISFAPAQAPEILIAILVESGGHGGDVCAPLARQMYAYYFGTPEPQVVPPPLLNAVHLVDD